MSTFEEAISFRYVPERGILLITAGSRILTRSEWELLRDRIDTLYNGNSEEDIAAILLAAQRKWSDDLHAEIREKKNRPKPITPGFVYVITSEQGRYKIGRTVSMSSRMANLNTVSPYNLQLICTFKCADPKQLEEKLHLKFAPSRKRGEWFDLSSDEVAWLRSFDGSEPSFETE